MSIHRSEAPVRMRSMHIAMNSPTPAPTVTSRTLLLICGTVCARTCRSGSATVMAKPGRTPRISGIFFVRVSAVPILLPMGVMDCSAPRENSPIPTTSITAPIRKHSSRSGRIGVTMRHSRSTMTAMGSTDSAASTIFSLTAVLFISS